MKRWRLIVELAAQQDIEAIHLWLIGYDSDAADRWLESLHETMASLEIFPERCPFAPENKYFKSEIRETFHGRYRYKYRIVFTITGSEVHILHVRHGSRLPLGQFPKE